VSSLVSWLLLGLIFQGVVIISH